MKQAVPIFLAIIFSLSIFGQTQNKIKVINGVTHRPVKKIYCYILKDNDKWIDIGQTDNNGIFTTHLRDLDSSATYQIDISESAFKPFRQTIRLFDTKQTTVTIYPDSAFVEKNPNLIYSECSSISFGNYEPREPHSIYDLPDSIRIKLAAHLTERLGPDFYSKLKLSGGQIVNLDRLYIVEDNAKNYKWIPYSYYLCFSFQDPAKGIGLYTAKIVLDKSGNVINEIQLPDIHANPEKATIISLEQAKKIAAENKFYDNKTEISLSYDAKNGSIAWCFKQSVFNPDHTMSGSTLVIDAHNGKVLGKYGIGGIWD